MVTGGENDPASVTPEERVDQALTQARYGQAGVGSLGAGEWMDSGGGSGGQFVFANLDELEAVRRKFEDLRDYIKENRQVTQQVQALCNPPAEDMMSYYQAGAGRDTASSKFEHDDTLLAYAQAYVDKLTACRNAMGATEQRNTDRLRATGEDLGHA